MRQHRLHLEPPTPKKNSITGNTHIFSGWYFDTEGKAARAIRLRIGNRLIPCESTERPDVRAFFDNKQDIELTVGFRSTFRTGSGPKLIHLEILDSDNRWKSITRRLIWATRSTSNSDVVNTSANTTSPFISNLDRLWQSCRGIKLNYSPESCAITWVIPDFNEGGGGHLNIFRMIKNLEDLGAPKQQILIIGNHSKKDRFQAKVEADKYFFKIKAEIYLQTDPLPETQAMVATAWQTAYLVKEQPDHIKKFYFVQDFEPLFHTAGSNSFLAANTYRFGFNTITAGAWIKDVLERDFCAKAISYGFSYDRHLYRPPTEYNDEFEFDIFFYARPFTERRMFDLGVAAIAETIRIAGRPLKIAFAGCDLPENCTPFPFKNLGVLSLNELAAQYGTLCTALVLSATNASLLPYELMACGCPVVTNQGANNEWLFPDGYDGVAPCTPEELGRRLFDIINQPEKRKNLSKTGLDIVSKTNWMNGAQSTLDFIKSENIV